jgi:citrate lyase beta subunit
MNPLFGKVLLFTPGNKPERFAKSASAGADGVILDLEDAVAPQSKEAARTAALDYLQQPVEASGFLRLNGLDTPEGMKDLAALHCAGVWPDIVLLPKVESGAATALLAKTAGPGARCLDRRACRVRARR